MDLLEGFEFKEKGVKGFEVFGRGGINVENRR
jgi:hypothetical protein